MIFLRLVRVFFEMIDVVDIVHSENPKKKILRCQVIESLFNKKIRKRCDFGADFS